MDERSYYFNRFEVTIKEIPSDDEYYIVVFFRKGITSVILVNDSDIASFFNMNVDDYRNRLIKYNGYLHNGSYENIRFKNRDDAHLAIDWLEGMMLLNLIKEPYIL